MAKKQMEIEAIAWMYAHHHERPIGGEFNVAKIAVMATNTSP